MGTHAEPLRGKIAQTVRSRWQETRTGSPDYGCEIMALVALMVLSALSHFWYIMIAICVAITLAGVSRMFCRMLVSARKKGLRRVVDPGSREAGMQAEVFIKASPGPGPSLPAA
jgi:hypothetical protein